MGFQLSPGVEIKEFDFTNIIPAVAASAGAFAGRFAWGPADEPVTISSENELKTIFGKPNNDNAEGWFAAANFLSYGRNLKCVRVVATDSWNAAVDETGTAITGEQIKNTKQWDDDIGTVQGSVAVAARYPGPLGNAIGVYWYNDVDDHTITGTKIYTDTGLRFKDIFNRAPNTAEGLGREQVTGGSQWAFENLTKFNDEINLVVIDRTGEISGIPNSVLEVYEGYSVYPGAKKPDGSSNNLLSAVNTSSEFIYLGNLFEAPNGTALDTVTTSTTITQVSVGTTGGAFRLTGGSDETPDLGDFYNADGTRGYGLFLDAEQIDISLVILGAPIGAANDDAEPAVHTDLAKYLIEDIAEKRKDCVVFVSPPYGGIMDAGTGADILSALLDWRNKTVCTVGAINGNNGFNKSTSYAVLDSGWKKQYDPYNDVYRWIPLNGDIAGLCARTDSDRDPWYSPAGLNRGQINRVVKLAFNPNKTQRDELYQAGINPIVSFPGQGVVLFGDKTALAKPSAFDRINVRRLFIVLEKAIATASKFQLFEFNDEFTRASFVSLVEPFLRDVQGRRGIFDFKVICDISNNTPEVIDSNRFVADIFIKPARSINFMTLNFVATRTGVDFSEVAGGVGRIQN